MDSESGALTNIPIENGWNPLSSAMICIRLRACIFHCVWLDNGWYLLMHSSFNRFASWIIFPMCHVPFFFEIIGLSHAVNMSQYAECTLESLICRASNRRVVFLNVFDSYFITPIPSRSWFASLASRLLPFGFVGDPHWNGLHRNHFSLTILEYTLFSDISRDHIVCYLSPRYLHCIPIFCNWIPKKCDVSHNPQWTHQLILQSPYFSHHHPPHHIPSPSPSPSTKNFILYIYIYPIIHHDYTIIQLLVAWHIIFIHVFCLILEAIFSHHAPTLLISC